MFLVFSKGQGGKYMFPKPLNSRTGAEKMGTNDMENQGGRWPQWSHENIEGYSSWVVPATSHQFWDSELWSLQLGSLF